MTNKAVIGLGFGDEGKGIFTDYLCSHSKNPLVVRFSGGHQVGHTVVTDFKRHVFSNFGSGTLREVPTFWSKFCTVEPTGFCTELEVLKSKGVVPKIYIDERCPITTPYDILSNQLFERRNGHGSVGVGFGETINRELNLYSLTFLDLFYPEIRDAKLDNIKNYYHEKWFPIDRVYADIIYSESISLFLAHCDYLVKKHSPAIRSNFFPNRFGSDAHDFIFEGSQGLMLDQNIGFYPNVTWSNTGTKNIEELHEENYPQVQPTEFYLVTRAYQTRHGNGFMSNENTAHNIEKNPIETNVKNGYQGEFKRSLLDVSMLEYAITKDKILRDVKGKSLVITCLDHVKNEHRFTYNGKIIACANQDEFVTKICKLLNIKTVYLSNTDNSKNIIKKELDKIGR